MNFIINSHKKAPALKSDSNVYNKIKLRKENILSSVFILPHTIHRFILAALYIADELLKLKENKDSLKEGFSDQISNMVELIEHSLK